MECKYADTNGRRLPMLYEPCICSHAPRNSQAQGRELQPACQPTTNGWIYQIGRTATHLSAARRHTAGGGTEWPPACRPAGRRAQVSGCRPAWLNIVAQRAVCLAVNAVVVKHRENIASKGFSVSSPCLAQPTQPLTLSELLPPWLAACPAWCSATNPLRNANCCCGWGASCASSACCCSGKQSSTSCRRVNERGNGQRKT